MPRFTAVLTWILLAASRLAGQAVTVEVRPEQATIIPGTQLRFSAVVRDAAGRELTGRRVTWSVVPDDIATIDTAGVLSGHHQGTTRVVATVDGKTGTAQAEIEAKDVARVEFETPQEVLMVGGQLVLNAVARTDDGEPLRGAAFSFRSSDDRLAAVDPAGVVMGRSEGTAFIVATSGRARAELRLRIVANRLSRLAITGPVTGRAGDVIRLRAMGEDKRLLPVPDLAVAWSVSGRGASIGPDGGFVAEQPGTYLVTASAGPVAAGHAIRVARRPAARGLEALGHVELPGRQVTSVWALGTAAWVTTRPGRIYAFDIRDPAHPVPTDSIAVLIQTTGAFATTADGAIGVVAMEGVPATRNGLLVLDLASPLHPRVLAEYAGTFTAGIRGLAIEGQNVFVAGGDGVLRVIGLAEPRRPAEVGRYILGGSPDGLTPSAGRRLHGIQVADGLAYLAGGRDGLVILDVGNGVRGGTPVHPRLVSQLVYNVADDYPPGLRAGTHAAVRHGRYVFLADEVIPASFDPLGLDRVPSLGRVHAVDVSDVARPALVAEYGLPGAGSQDLSAAGDALFVAFGEGGLRGVDVSGELRGDLLAQGRELGALWTGSVTGFRPNLAGAVSVRPLGDLIVVGDANSGLWIARLAPLPSPE